MESLFYLVPIALVFVFIAVKVFFWAVDNGQFDDLDTEAQRILFDDDESVPAQDKKTQNVNEKSEKNNSDNEASSQ